MGCWGVPSWGEALRGSHGKGLATGRREDVRAGSPDGLTPALPPAAPQPLREVEALPLPARCLGAKGAKAWLFESPPLPRRYMGQ